MEKVPEYEIKRELGSGCFGYVFEAINLKTGRKVAIKRIEKVGKQLSREYEVLKALIGSTHCVQLLECFYTKSKKDKLVQNLVFEFLSDDLEDLIRRFKRKRERVGFFGNCMF